MLKEAGLKLGELDYVKAQTAALTLDNVIQITRDDPERFKKLNPENGWGNYDDLLSRVLKPMLRQCQEHPQAIIRIL